MYIEGFECEKDLKISVSIQGRVVSFQSESGCTAMKNGEYIAHPLDLNLDDVEASRFNDIMVEIHEVLKLIPEDVTTLAEDFEEEVSDKIGNNRVLECYFHLNCEDDESYMTLDYFDSNDINFFIQLTLQDVRRIVTFLFGK